MPNPRYALARSYLLGGNIAAVVTDSGGAGRAVTVASIGDHVRPLLAAAGGSGTSTESPLELFARTTLMLSIGSGGGTWGCAITADGRTIVTWTGTGTGTISSGTLLAALGFAGAVGPLASGASQTSTYSALGLLTWPRQRDDSGWQPMAPSSARTQTNRGVLVIRKSQYVMHRRIARVWWVPREWSNNAAGDYHSPVWSDEARAGANTYASPDPSATAAAWTWCHAIYGTGDTVQWGFTDALASALSGTMVRAVYLGPEMFDDARVTMPAESPTYESRRDIALALYSTGSITL